MKSNKVMWGIVALVVMATAAISLGTLNGRTQEKSKGESSPTPDKSSEDLGKYAIADYDASQPGSTREWQERVVKSRRYDNWGFVRSNPSPDLFGATTRIPGPPPDVVPVSDSNLIVLGKITSATAYLSADKGNVYTEYAVKIDEIFKDDTSKKRPSSLITVDRAGGFVRYPNGHKMLYTVKGTDLPRVGDSYVLFLTRKDESPNYQILTAYEIQNENARAIDVQSNSRNVKFTTKSSLIDAVCRETK